MSATATSSGTANPASTRMPAGTTTFTDGYPVVLRMAGRRALVVGGGQVGAAKARGLLDAGAVVTVVAPDVDASMPDGVRVLRRPFRRADLRRSQLVFAATADRRLNQRIFDLAGRRGLFVCSVDDPERCSFALPAVHRDGPVLIAVSTGGASPTLAQVLRDRCAAAVPDDLAAVADALARARATARAEHGTSEGLAWRPIVEQLLDGTATAAAFPVPTAAAVPVPTGPGPGAGQAGAPAAPALAAADDRWLRALAGVTA